MAQALIAGAATADITPKDSQFLFGYPHVPRYSTGVHDPLLSSALFLSDGDTSLLFIANDIIYVSRESAGRVRTRIERETGVPAAHIMVTATHTHSGPLTADMLGNESDAVIPTTDPRYVELMENGIVQAAVRAHRNARPAELGLAIADGSCVGGNRQDIMGPSNPDVPVLVVRERDSHANLAAMVVCSMHPTVLHEDSTLISGDFPAMTRQYLQEHVLGRDCTVVFHTGPCGDQSPRNVTKANTFDEATRLGHLLGGSIADAIRSISCTADITLACARTFVELPTRTMPPVEQAKEQLDQAATRLAMLRESKVDRREVRTAECDWFGAEETLALARAAAQGRLEATIAAIMPAEIMLMRIGPWLFVGWPGETFVEFSLSVKAARPNCHVIGLVNGELQGYLATEEAVRQHWYEAMNSLFTNPDAGLLFVEKTLELLAKQET